ncbi:hypothetical protein AB3S75_047549 [Citrus x aurantiifolia]
MTGLEEEAPANSLPAAAVKRGGQVFFGMTGRKGHVGGVKSGDLRRNAKSEGSSLGPYRRWSAKACGANGIRYPGAAWLSSARVVRCLVKSYNERNPRFVLLRHAPKEKVFATEVTTTSSWRRRKTRHSGEPPGGVGLPVIYWRKVGMTSSPHGPYGLGHTRATMAITMGSKAVRWSESGKIASVRIVLCNSGT